MSEDESFVILGTSPLPSIDIDEQNETCTPPEMSFSSLKSSQIKASNHSLSQMQASNVSRAAGNDSLTTSAGTEKEENSAQPITAECVPTPSPRNVQTVITNNDISSSNTGGKGQTHSSVLTDSSLAVSFIAGDISADVLKTSIYSQSPSLSMGACAEDVVKLSNLMKEYVELKDTLAKVNCTMKQFYNKTTKWRDDMQLVEQNYKQELEKCNTQIASLRNENLELKYEITEKIDLIKKHDELRKSEHDELLQTLSERTAQLQNMRVQIDNLEQQQLASYDYLPKNENDSKEKPDYVDTLEHQRICKEFERKLSECVAENYDLKDVQKQYVDEINLLNVKLVAAEELIRQSRADIDLLKAKDLEKSIIFTKYETERNETRLEVALLREQVDVYRKDFDVERNARQNIAGEKDQLLQDLRAMQRKNQELIEEQQKRCAFDIESKFSTSGQASTSQARTIPKEAKKNCCPVCMKSFTSLASLQDHVNDCLDRA